MTNPSETARAGVDALTQAVKRYFDLMYDSDVSRFDASFDRRPNCMAFAMAICGC